MKDLIIGAITNYRPEHVSCWINSIRKSGFSGDVIVVDFGTPADTIEYLHNRGAKIYQADLNGRHIVVERFIAMYSILEEVKQSYRFVIATDVKDVIFQQNPSLWLKRFEHNQYRLFPSSENILYKDEDWGNNNLKVSFPHLYERFKGRVIRNAGTISGESYAMRDLFMHIYHLSLLGGDRQPDQAAYNILLNTYPFNTVVFAPDQYDPWVANLGTTIADNVKDKYESFQINPVPNYDDNGIVYNSKNNPYYIVHQYDRIKDLREIITRKFGILN